MDEEAIEGMVAIVEIDKIFTTKIGTTRIIRIRAGKRTSDCSKLMWEYQNLYPIAKAFME